MENEIKEKSDSELLAIILGVPKDNLRMYDLSAVMTAPRAIEGVGEKKESRVYALQEVSRRLMSKSCCDIQRVHGPEDAAHFLMGKYKFEAREHFLVVILNTKNNIIATPEISVGSLSASVVHPREVFREVLKYPAASIILAHNHPSGDPSPSREDIAVTARLVKAGKIMDIPVLDHIILGDSRFISLKEKGLID